MTNIEEIETPHEESPEYQNGLSNLPTVDKCLLCHRPKREETGKGYIEEGDYKPSVIQLPLWVCSECRKADRDYMDPEYDEVMVPDVSLGNIYYSSEESLSDNRSIHWDDMDAQMLQSYWMELRHTVRCIYRKAGTNLAIDPSSCLDIEKMKSLVHKLCRKGPHQLYHQLETQGREYVEEVKFHLLEHLLCHPSSIGTPQHAREFAVTLLDEYEQLMCATVTLQTFLSQIEEEHMVRFGITWQLVNQHLFHEVVYNDPIIQKSMPGVLVQLRYGQQQSPNSSSKFESYESVSNRLEGFERDMVDIEQQWIKAIVSLAGFVNEKACQKAKQKILTDDWEFLEKQQKLLKIESPNICENLSDPYRNFSDAMQQLKECVDCECVPCQALKLKEGKPEPPATNGHTVPSLYGHKKLCIKQQLMHTTPRLHLPPPPLREPFEPDDPGEEFQLSTDKHYFPSLSDIDVKVDPYKNGGIEIQIEGLEEEDDEGWVPKLRNNDYSLSSDFEQLTDDEDFKFLQSSQSTQYSSQACNCSACLTLMESFLSTNTDKSPTPPTENTEAGQPPYWATSALSNLWLNDLDLSSLPPHSLYKHLHTDYMPAAGPPGLRLSPNSAFESKISNVESEELSKSKQCSSDISTQTSSDSSGKQFKETDCSPSPTELKEGCQRHLLNNEGCQNQALREGCQNQREGCQNQREGCQSQRRLSTSSISSKDSMVSEKESAKAKYCACCYCELVGHAGPPLAQTSHNYEQLREKLRKKLEKRNPDKPKKEIKDVGSPQALPVDDRPVEDLVSFIEGPTDQTKPSKKKKKSKTKENQLKEAIQALTEPPSTVPLPPSPSEMRARAFLSQILPKLPGKPKVEPPKPIFSSPLSCNAAQATKDQPKEPKASSKEKMKQASPSPIEPPAKMAKLPDSKKPTDCKSKEPAAKKKQPASSNCDVEEFSYHLEKFRNLPHEQKLELLCNKTFESKLAENLYQYQQQLLKSIKVPEEPIPTTPNHPAGSRGAQQASKNCSQPKDLVSQIANDTAAGAKKRNKKKKKRNESLDDIFLPRLDLEDIDLLDESERELENFKRFCMDNQPLKQRQKIQLKSLNLNNNPRKMVG